MRTNWTLGLLLFAASCAVEPGPQGPVGPQGPAGPQGPIGMVDMQGLADMQGLSAGSLLVIDGNLKPLGTFLTFLFSQSVMYRDAAGLIWTVQPDGNYDYTNMNQVAFASANCSGTPISDRAEFPNRLLYDGGMLYKVQGAPTLKTAGSERNTNDGSCRSPVFTPSDLRNNLVLVGALPAPPPPPISLQ